MPESRDRIDERLREAFKAGVPEPEYDTDKAPPEEVPAELKARVIEEAKWFSTRLLVTRLCAAGEEAGWRIDDLASEAGGCETDAKRVLLGEGSPLELQPTHLAKIFFRARFGPDQWVTLLFQAAASQATYRQAARGQIWGRTSGLSDPMRAENLLSSMGSQSRDPAWAERVARNFVDEVLDEWKKLTAGTR